MFASRTWVRRSAVGLAVSRPRCRKYHESHAQDHDHEERDQSLHFHNDFSFFEVINTRFFVAKTKEPHYISGVVTLPFRLCPSFFRRFNILAPLPRIRSRRGRGRRHRPPCHSPPYRPRRLDPHTPNRQPPRQTPLCRRTSDKRRLSFSISFALTGLDLLFTIHDLRFTVHESETSQCRPLGQCARAGNLGELGGMDLRDTRTPARLSFLKRKN